MHHIKQLKIWVATAEVKKVVKEAVKSNNRGKRMGLNYSKG